MEFLAYVTHEARKFTIEYRRPKAVQKLSNSKYSTVLN